MSITLKSASALVLAALLTLSATTAQAGTAKIQTGGATGCCRQLVQ